jgi:hypothetical protein
MPQQENIVFDKEWDRIQSWLGNMPGKLAPKAMRGALNETIKEAKPVMIKAVKDHYKIPPKEVSKTQFAIQKATVNDLTARTRATGRPIPLYAFGKPSPAMNQGWKRPPYYSDVTGKRQVIDNLRKKATGNKGFVTAVYGRDMVNGKSVSRHPGFIKTKKDFNQFKILAKGVGYKHPGHLGFFVRKAGVQFRPNLPIEELFSIAAPGGMLAKRTNGMVANAQSAAFRSKVDKWITKVLSSRSGLNP